MTTETGRVDELIGMLGEVSDRLEETSTALSNLVSSYLNDKRWRRFMSTLIGFVMVATVAVSVLAIHTAVAAEREQCLRNQTSALNVHRGVDSVVDRVVEGLTFGEGGIPDDWAVELAESTKKGIREDVPVPNC